MQLVTKRQYEEKTAKSRDRRMAWWRDAKFGMFISYGLYSLRGMEWATAAEGMTIAECEKLAESFKTKEGACREWISLAKRAGMKYAVLTTRHHEGFSLWDSKINSFNSVNYGAKRDVVREFVDACREYDIKIGFYFSLMDWHHPDGYKCAYDQEARRRFTDYIKELNRELMSNYGKIDILWYDAGLPMESHEGWNMVEINTMVRELQPDIIINNRCWLDEDFKTIESRLGGNESCDWESAMTFNEMSWSYVDSKKVQPYSYTPHRVARMLNVVLTNGGNLLLNIGIKPDGSVPDNETETLITLGKWIEQNQETVYCPLRRMPKTGKWEILYTNLMVFGGEKIYIWNYIWPDGEDIKILGFDKKVKSAEFLNSGKKIEFIQKGFRLTLKNLPKECPDKILGISVIKLTFDETPQYYGFPTTPQLNNTEFSEPDIK